MDTPNTTESEVATGEYKTNDDLRAEVAIVKELFIVAGQRLTAVETRLAPIELAVAKIPSLESHLGRVDVMLLTMQGDIRRMEKSANEHALTIQNKLDELKALLLGRRDT